DGAFAILNFAGASIGFPPIPWWLPGRKENIMQSRVHAGNAIVDAVRAAKTKPRVVMQMSGSNFYGLRGDQSIAENETAGNDFPARVCVEWENATNEIESLGVRRVIARTAPVLTKRGGVLFYLALPFKFFVGGALGNGKQWFAWIHVADFIAAIRFLLENENARGAFNLAAPNPLINADFARALARILKRPNWFPAPGWIFKFVFGELGETMVLGSQRVIPRRLQAMGFQFQFADAASALQDLLKEK
ncbi:MAG: TIGR01777 family protein, partial [Chloroflexi bacterium]|nr:TIGR01777 family protein [Chloroflexota bacterium]